MWTGKNYMKLTKEEEGCNFCLGVWKKLSSNCEVWSFFFLG
jgi:hypothetical protein